MKEIENNKETDKYGVNFGEISKFLVDIIGQNVILDYISKNIKNGKEAKKKREAFKQNLDRMYRGQAVYKNFAIIEENSPQWYIEQFFKEVIEKKYNLPDIVFILIDNLTWQLFFSLATYTPFEKPKSETVLFLLRKQVFCFIYYNLLNRRPLSNGKIYSISIDSIINFLTDNFYKIFSEIRNKYKSNENFKKQKANGLESMLQKIFENKKTFHGKVENFYDDNVDKYPRLDTSDDSPNYRQDIYNWQKKDIDPTWKTLEPILDFLKENNGTPFTCRLIGHYFLRNAQKALENVLHISQEEEQEKIITDIVTMIIEKKKPEEFFKEDILEFYEQINLINMCLVNQCQENYDPVKSDKIIKTIENKCTYSKIFFSPWLIARAKVFEAGETLIKNKELHDSIIKGYKKAFDEGINYAGAYLGQFLVEAIIINRFCNPRQVKDVNDYHGYGYALELFGSQKQGLLDLIKDTDNLQIELIKILYSYLSPIGNTISKNFPSLNSILEFHNEAIIRNNKGLEFKEANSFELAIQYFTEAIQLNPGFIDAYSNRGHVFINMSKIMSEPYTEYALVDLNMALLLDPKHENTLFNRGLLLLMNGKIESAITDFTQLIIVNPKDSEAYLNRGICYRYMKYFDRAIEDYNKALEINPCYAEAYQNRGVVYTLLGNIS